MNKHILITGASGLIGKQLTALLQAQGFKASHLSRSNRDGTVPSFLWDVNNRQIDGAALLLPDTIIHLAGASIAEKPWTNERKNEILRSRTESTRLLYHELQKGNHNIKSFIAASAIGYYGAKETDKLFDESDGQGDDFLAEVVDKWEKAVDQIASLGIRVVKIRIGIVLSEKDGALKEMMRPVKFYVGSPLGTGTQHMSWIHLDDLCRIFIKAADDERMHGVYNGVAPNPVTNKEFIYTLARAMQKPIILPQVPAFILKLLLGEMADLVLTGVKVSAQKIQATGFQFKFDKLEDALKDLLHDH